MLFIVNILAARGLGPEGYGQFAFLMSIGILIWLFAEAGLTTLFLREASKSGTQDKLQILWEEFFGLASLLGVAGYLLFILIIGIIDRNLFFYALFFGLSIWMMLISITATTIFRAKEEQKYFALGFILHKLCILILVLCWMSIGLSLRSMILIYVVSDLFWLILNLYLIGRRYELKIRYRWLSWAKVKQKLFASVGIASGQLLRRSTFLSELIICYVLLDPARTGIYAVCFRFLQAVAQVSQSASTAFLPPLLRQANDLVISKATKKYIFALLIVGALISAAMYLTADYAHFIFGDKYLQVNSLLKIESLAVPFLFLQPFFFFLFTARYQEFAWARWQFIFLILNVLLAVMLIKSGAVVGAIWSRVIAEFLSCCVVFWLAKKCCNI